MSNSTFTDLLNQAFEDLTQTDFQALRHAYTQEPEYDPTTRRDTAPIHQAVEQQNWDTAEQLCLEALKEDYLQISVHLLLTEIYEAQDYSDGVNWHQTFADQLTAAILDTGDGSQPESAFEIIHLREEYDVMRHLGIQPFQRNQEMIKGERYDIFDLSDTDGTPQGQIFFKVEAMLARASQAIQQRRPIIDQWHDQLKTIPDLERYLQPGIGISYPILLPQADALHIRYFFYPYRETSSLTAIMDSPFVSAIIDANSFSVIEIITENTLEPFADAVITLSPIDHEIRQMREEFLKRFYDDVITKYPTQPDKKTGENLCYLLQKVVPPLLWPYYEFWGNKFFNWL